MLKETCLLLRPKITMTLLVRNEEDIIADTILFHHALGVDSFIVMDNLSTDATPDILRDLSQTIEIDYIIQLRDDYDQSAWVTEMARHAATDHKADWIINSDADEFWIPERGDLSTLLADLSPQTAALKVQRHNAVVTLDSPSGIGGRSHPRTSMLFERESTNNLGKPLPGKILHRASEGVTVAQGNHNIRDLPGKTEHAGDRLRILHYPYRSLELYREKIRLGGAAYARNSVLPSSVGATWRSHYAELDSGTIERFWSRLSETSEEVEIGLLSGRLSREKSVVEVLAAPRQKRLQLITDRFLGQSRKLVEEFSASQAKLMDPVPREVRWTRPMYYNLRFAVNGAKAHQDRLTELMTQTDPETLCAGFSDLRDAFSLFPRNPHAQSFLSDLLEISQGPEVARLRMDCAGKRVILHTSCHPRLTSSLESLTSFENIEDQEGYHHIVLLGAPQARSENETPLSFAYDGRILEVPVPDSYEHLHRKLFFAYTLLSLLTSPEMVVKIDDNLILEHPSKFVASLDRVSEENAQYAGRRVGAERHEIQWHGWHVGKCADPVIESRGYQYPLPRDYASGGYGYVLGSEGLKACSYMYLMMKEFFAMHAIGLEDACVGHAVYAQRVELLDISEMDNLIALPGLMSKERLRRDAQWVLP